MTAADLDGQLDELVALAQLDRASDERVVRLAMDLLVAGADTPGLRVLASAGPPFHVFEMRALVARVLRELGRAPFADAVAAACVLLRRRAAQVVAGTVPLRVALAEFAGLAVELDHPRELMDFYHLHDAWSLLDGGGAQWDWPGADRGNIAAIVAARFQAVVTP